MRSSVRTKTTISEKDTIDANANEVASVRLAHRKDIQRSRKIAMSLFDELEMMVGQENVKLLEMLGELMWSPDDKGNDKVNDLYMKIISMPGRVKSMKDLSDTLKTLIALERQAFGLDDENNKPVDALTALLERVSTGNSSAFKPIHHSSIIHHPSSHHHITTSSHHPTSSMQKICENLRKESAKICEKLIVTSPHHHITSSSNFQHAKNLRETHHPIITS